MFIYKMYGKFDDVTPCEYLQVQLDLSAFRMSWDQNAAHCRVIEQDLDEKNRSLSQVRFKTGSKRHYSSTYVVLQTFP